MTTDGALADVLGPIIGVGPGRGMALLIMCGGAWKLLMLTGVVGDRRLRQLDVPPGVSTGGVSTADVSTADVSTAKT